MSKDKMWRRRASLERVALGLWVIAHLVSCMPGGELDEQGRYEASQCLFPVAPPPGEYVNQGVAVDYHRLAPLPDPKRGDLSYGRQVVDDPRALEQIYYDSTHGNPSASWLICNAEVSARQLGRSTARYLSQPSCQTFQRCSIAFEELPFSRQTASGLRVLALIGEAFEDEAIKLELRQEAIGYGLSMLAGIKMMRSVRAPPQQTGAARFQVLDDATLANIHGAGPTQGFTSFTAFKRALGSAGPGKHWHHIVEQTPGNIARFGAATIHNTSNIIAIDAKMHRQISAYYSKKFRFTRGLTLRQWLSTQSFEAQREFGIQVLTDFRAFP